MAPNLTLTETPSTICVSGGGLCPAGTEVGRVTMTATAPSTGIAAWPAVQVVFVLETDPYDGVFDHTAGNASIYNSYPAMCSSLDPLWLCGETNTVEAFIANASVYTERLQAAHPLTRMSFGLVDFFATHDRWDDSDGSEYHVDIGHFVNASEFAAAVHDSLQTRVLNGSYILPNSTLADNSLYSSSITALYGTLMGAGIGWTSDAHHVIVWVGSTAPRDPNYEVNLCQTLSPHVPKNVTSPTDPSCYSPSCEPAYNFGAGIESPRCEGWAVPQDGNASDSIAQLAYSAPDCVDSLGGSCTIDTIDTPTTAIDPDGPWDYNWSVHGSATSLCTSWGDTAGGCSRYGVISNQQYYQTGNRTIAAGCDLAQATGGSWDGPDWWDFWNVSYNHYDPAPPASCGGTNGTLAYNNGDPPTRWTGPCSYTSIYECDVGHEYFNTSNPTLIAALASVGLGAPPTELALAAPADGAPLFRFVPWGNIQLAPYLGLATACQRASGYPENCAYGGDSVTVDGVETLTFNWSADPNLNVLQAGDSWQASFNVIGVGPPYGVLVPVDACTAPGCAAAGSQPILGKFSRADYIAANGSTVSQSFPLARLTVENAPVPTAPTSSSPPPPPPAGETPPVPAPAPLPLPVTQPIPVATVAASAGLISIPAATAGILLAGLTRVLLRGRAVAMRMAMKAGPMGAPRGGRGSSRAGDGSGTRFE